MGSGMTVLKLFEWRKLHEAEVELAALRYGVKREAERCAELSRIWETDGSEPYRPGFYLGVSERLFDLL